jgi:hypothetical protein
MKTKVKIFAELVIEDMIYSIAFIFVLRGPEVASLPEA